jgi:DHA1 family inner membrane transport protein
MAYFRNTTVNLLNLHYGIHSVALSGAGAFYIVYLLKAGVPVPGVLGALALILAGRFVIRPIVVPLAVRFGIRKLVIVGTLLSACQYPLVAEVHGIGWSLLILCLVSSLGDSIYWSSYHAYFASLGDREDRGSQIGAREAIAAIVGIVSPILASGALVAFGPRIAFGLTAIVLLVAAIPILFTPNVRVARSAPGAYKAAMTGALLFLSDGWTCAGYYFAWQIALFISLGENFLAYGGALALAALAGAIGGMLLGRHIDAGHGTRAVWYAFVSLFLSTGLRLFAPGHAALAIFANATGSLVGCLYTPTIMTAVYNQAKRSPDTLRFHVLAEGGWDIGAGSACLLIAALAWYGVPLSAGILTSVAGSGSAFYLLRKYYAAHPTLDPDLASFEIPVTQSPPV